MLQKNAGNGNMVAIHTKKWTIDYGDWEAIEEKGILIVAREKLEASGIKVNHVMVERCVGSRNCFDYLIKYY